MPRHSGSGDAQQHRHQLQHGTGSGMGLAPAQNRGRVLTRLQPPAAPIPAPQVPGPDAPNQDTKQRNRTGGEKGKKGKSGEKKHGTSLTGDRPAPGRILPTPARQSVPTGSHLSCDVPFATHGSTQIL